MSICAAQARTWHQSIYLGILRETTKSYDKVAFPVSYRSISVPSLPSVTSYIDPVSLCYLTEARRVPCRLQARNSLALSGNFPHNGGSGAYIKGGGKNRSKV